jgi:hypothetical protein
MNIDIIIYHHIMEVEINCDRLYHIATGAWKAGCFASAIELGVFECLKEGNKMGKTELAKAVGIDKFGRPEDLFDTLVSMELLSKQDNMYSNSCEVEKYCVKGKEEYMG